MAYWSFWLSRLFSTWVTKSLPRVIEELDVPESERTCQECGATSGYQKVNLPHNPHIQTCDLKAVCAVVRRAA